MPSNEHQWNKPQLALQNLKRHSILSKEFETANASSVDLDNPINHQLFEMAPISKVLKLQCSGGK